LWVGLKSQQRINAFGDPKGVEHRRVTKPGIVAIVEDDAQRMQDAGKLFLTDRVALPLLRAPLSERVKGKVVVRPRIPPIIKAL